MVRYPLYDAHGNMVATLHRSGMGSFGLSDSRSYDAWGSVRLGNATGDPKHAYCASLGHVKDDESGLTYMRARYYESSTGRFISEDPEGDGFNWYVYCGNNPISYVDGTGNSPKSLQFTLGDLTFRLDFDKFEPDLHVFDRGGSEIWSRFASGAMNHKDVAENLKKILNAIVDALKSGDKSMINNLKKLAKYGSFGLGEDFVEIMAGVIGGALPCGIAYTSIDAYAQQDPADFMDTMKTIFTGGRDYN
jgi:RHS repeat-associated protein